MTIVMERQGPTAVVDETDTSNADEEDALLLYRLRSSLGLSKDLDYLFENEDDDDGIASSSASSAVTSSVSSFRRLLHQQHQQPTLSQTALISDEQLLLEWDPKGEEEEEEFSVEESSSIPVEEQEQQQLLALTAAASNSSLQNDNNNLNTSTNSSSSMIQEWKERLQMATRQQETLQEQLDQLKRKQQQTSPSKRQASPPKLLLAPVTAVTTTQHTTSTELLSRVPISEEPLSPEKQQIDALTRLNTDLQSRWQTQQRKTAELQQQLVSLQKEDQPSSSHECTTPNSTAAQATIVATTPNSNEVAKLSQHYQEERGRRMEYQVLCQSLQQQLEQYQAITVPKLEILQQVKQQHSMERKETQQEMEEKDIAYQTLKLKMEQHQIQREEEWEQERQELLHQHAKEKEEMQAKHRQQVGDLQEQLETVQRQHDQQQETWQAELQAAIAEYQELHGIYARETKEWQTLLELEINRSHELQIAQDRISSVSPVDEQEEQPTEALERTSSPFRESTALALLSPILPSKQQTPQHGIEDSLEYDSSVMADESTNNEMNNKLEDLMKELGQMDQERNALLEQVQDTSTSLSSLALLSPMLPSKQQTPQHGLHVFGIEDSLEYDSSVIADESTNNEMNDKLEDLLKELGQMDQERNALLEQVQDTKTSLSSSSGRVREAELSTDQGAQDEQPIEEDIEVASIEENEDSKNHGIDSNKEADTTSPDKRGDSSEGEDGAALVVKGANDSSMLEDTLNLLLNLKDLMSGQGDETEKETSVLEQLEVLSELMQDEGETSLLLSTSRLSENLLALYSPNKNENSFLALQDENNQSSVVETNDSALETSFPQATNISVLPSAAHSPTSNPWSALVKELNEKIQFLAHDRSELARVTNDMMEMERKSHQIQQEAAVATARRQGLEQLHEYQQQTQHQVKNLYRTLCIHCQRRIYTAI